MENQRSTAPDNSTSTKDNKQPKRYLEEKDMTEMEEGLGYII
jgi:hypothetical protein